MPSQPEPADLLIRGRYLLPMVGGATVQRDGAVAIRGNTIAAVGPAAELAARFTPTRVIDAGNAVILPGMVNAHTHVAMTIFRGLADDLPLDVWLKEHIWPAEARYLSPETVRWGAQLGAIELIRSGATTLCDMYFFEDDVARALKAVGMRAVLGQGVLDFPTPQGLDVDANLAYAAHFLQTWQGDPLIVPAIAPHAPYTVSAELQQRCFALAHRYHAPIHTHLSESKAEVEGIRRQYGANPIVYLDRLGVLDSNVIAAHCVWVTRDEIAILAERGVGVSHNPRSNLKLGSGVAPVPRLLAADVAVGLGTDGAASNNRLDLFAELDLAALVHKGVDLDPLAVDAPAALAMATIGGARAVKLDHLIGSLEVGKRADVVVVGLDHTHLTPLYDPLSHLAYAARGSDVRTVVIDGRVVLDEGRITTVDEVEVRREVAAIAHRIRGD